MWTLFADMDPLANSVQLYGSRFVHSNHALIPPHGFQETFLNIAESLSPSLYPLFVLNLPQIYYDETLKCILYLKNIFVDNYRKSNMFQTYKVRKLYYLFEMLSISL